MRLLHIEDRTAEFLKALAERIETQDSHGTAHPYYYTVRCEKEIAVPEGATGNVKYFDPQTTECYTEKELRDACKENEEDFDEVVGRCTKYDVDTMDEDHNVFLTLAGYEEHMKLNGHNYRHYKSHRPYIQGAFRNPEMMGLIGALREIGSVLENTSAESCLHEVCMALGWQGGTIHQVLDEIKRLKAKETE